MSPTRATLGALIVASGIVLSGGALAQPTSAGETSADRDEAKKTEARTRFERGMALMKEEAWDAALAEFFASRELFPSRGNTQNAAVCLTRLHRFDEALDMFEAVLREFPNLSAPDRSVIDGEIEKLRTRVGTIEVRILEPGATIVIDGRSRGTTPASAPLRASAGSHVVRMYKAGFAPFERRVEVPGGQNAVVDGRMERLTRSGRLKVEEQSGQVVDVLIDNLVVGKTPWEGPVAVGSHVVVLRGSGDLGTQPATAPIRLDDLTVLNLAVEPLQCDLRVEPTPMNATVAIDGIVVGRGLWEGRLRAGAHRVEVAAEGFLPARRELSLVAGRHERAAVELERDPSSRLWQAQNPARFVFDLQLGAALSPTFAGELDDGCAGSCSKTWALGALAVVHGGYQLSSGLGFTLDVGYAVGTQSFHGREAALRPVGLSPDQGVADDRLVLNALLLGASASLHRGSSWTWLLRLGGGVLFGQLSDERSGRFTTNLTPMTYDIAPIEESAGMVYAYVAPTIGVGHRVGSHFELGVALEGMLLFAASQPTWRDTKALVAGDCSAKSAPPNCKSDGQAGFGQQALMGKALFFGSPALVLRYEL